MAKPEARIMLPEGRIVSGHPMTTEKVTDIKTGAVKLKADGVTPRESTYVAIAIPKTAGVDWKNTDWGRQIVQVATESWPNGQTGMLTFAWKITDGDSTIPNKKGRKPCEQEGWPGHWIVHISTELGLIRCFWNGRYAEHELITNPKEIKRGDYGRAYISVTGNGTDNESPGIYLNPLLFSVDRVGDAIMGNAPLAADVFGNGTAAAGAFPPVGWQVHPQSPSHYFKGDEVKTEAELRAMMPPPAPVAPTTPTAPAAPAVPSAPAAPAVPVAPVQAVFPPVGWQVHPQSPSHYFKGDEVKTEAELRTMYNLPQAAHDLVNQ